MIEFSLPTMTCGHCVRSVTETVRRVDPSAELTVDLPAHRVQIRSSRPVEDFARELTEEGFAPA